MAAAELDHLRTVLTIARSGSVSEAARLLGLSQPTVSTHLAQVEARVGFRVFDRSHTGTTATVRGAELLRRISGAVDTLEDVLEAAPQVRPALQLGGPAELSSQVLVPRLPALVAAAQGAVRFTFDLAEPLISALRHGELDLVVSGVRPAGTGLTSWPLFDEEFVLVAAPSLLAGAGLDDHNGLASGQNGLASGQKGLADGLERLPVVAYAEALPIVRRYWRSVFERPPSNLTLAAVVPDLRAVRDAVVAGAGMSVLPTYLVTQELADGRLVIAHRPDVAPLNTVLLLARTGEVDRDPRLRACAAAVRDAVRDAGLT